MSIEISIMQLIAKGGDARSYAMKAIRLARTQQLEEAHASILEGRQCITQAHQVQTDLIQKEARGESTPISLLMIHAQDHLMNAMTVLDLAEEFIKVYETREKL